MEALSLNALGKKDEAKMRINMALMQNLKSHTAWHIFGMIHRSNKDYDDARSCFKKSIEFNKSNQNVLRDLLLLEFHTEQSTVETITKLMNTQNRNTLFTACYLVSHVKDGNYERALKFID